MDEDRSMTEGYYYVAVGHEVFLKEAEISARSLRRWTDRPIALYTDWGDYQSDLFDEIIVESDPIRRKSFVTKVQGLNSAPFDKTIFLDNDTFVCLPIDDVFEILDHFDLAVTQEPSGHSYGYWRQYNPEYELRMREVWPEYHTGVMGIRKNDLTRRLMARWLEVHQELDIHADMCSFRETVIEFFEQDDPVHIHFLPHEYNFQGIKSGTFAYLPIRVIHERLGERWGDLRARALDFEAMSSYAEKINRLTGKRLVLPYGRPIPYWWSPFYVKSRIKRMLGVKMKPKRL